jgi:23S rRNA (uracil1939-C5)-methyltransferase
MRPGRRPAGRRIVESRVESLAAGGDGVARMPDGRALFVPFTAPGDLARIEVVEERSRFARGVLAELLEPGEARRVPRCPVFGECGGCTWQHLDYTAQLTAKVTIVREALTRIAKLDALPEPEVVPSPEPYRYRGRARVLVDSGQVGFRRYRSNRIREVSRCPVLLQPAEDALARLARDVSRPSAAVPSGEWELFVGEDGQARSAALVEQSAHEVGSVAALRVAGMRVRVSPGVFAQANFLLHEALYREVEAAVAGEDTLSGRSAASGEDTLSGRSAASGEDLLLELYAGAGFFTLGLAGHFAQTLAVESHPGAVADLEHNLAHAGLSRVEIVEGSVEEYLAAAARRAGAREVPSPDVVLLDPPRSGLAPGAAADLLTLAAPRVVYLSCDPATLSRDVASLCREGYRLVALRVIDLFPQTSHVETLATLELSR